MDIRQRTEAVFCVCITPLRFIGGDNSPFQKTPYRKPRLRLFNRKQTLPTEEQDSEITAIIPTVICDSYIVGETRSKVNIFITLPILL